jgi:signal transduction histidine kinase
MLFHKKVSSTKYSFSLLTRMSIIIAFSFFIFIMLLVGSYMYFYGQLSEYEKKIVKEKVSLVLSTHEQFRLTSKFNVITKTIWGLEQIDGVVLFDKNCNVIQIIPINLNIKSNCKNINGRDWIMQAYNDEYSDLGFVATKIRSEIGAKIFSKIFPVIFFVILFTLFITFLTLMFFKRFLRKPLKQVASSISELSEMKEGRNNQIKYPKETEPIFEALFKTKNDLKIAQNKLIEQAELKIKQKLYDQVSHDIRSPLAALDTLIDHINSIPESKRNLVRHAVNRIHNIANKLLQGTNKKMQGLETPMLYELVNSMIMEKRVEFQSCQNIEVHFNYNTDAYGIFVKVDSTEFKNILSNLLNNSKEALKESKSGNILVSIKDDKTGYVELEINDNGCGISKKNLPQVLNKGATFGKTGGRGEGLYLAKTNIKKWHGTIKIESEENKFTRVIINLPKSRPPAWFVPEIKLQESTEIIVVDDDSSIHQIWKNRFGVFKGARKIKHYYTPHEIINEYSSKTHDNILFLIDFEYFKHKKNGFDIIKELHIEKESILVTSRYEEEFVQNTCKKLKIKLLPKSMASLVPIKSENTKDNSKLDAILIDDDEIVRLNWAAEAEMNGIKLKTFSNSKDFLSELSTINRNTKIYIDSNLGESQKGEDIAKNIHESGFENIFITTGYEKEKLPQMPWVKDVIDKSSPWS